MVLWISEWRRTTAGWFTPHVIKDVKMKLQRKRWEFFVHVFVVLLQLAWLGVPGHRYRVRGEGSGKSLGVTKVFKGPSRGAR